MRACVLLGLLAATDAYVMSRQLMPSTALARTPSVVCKEVVRAKTKAERRELKQERTWRFSGQIKVRATECLLTPIC